MHIWQTHMTAEERQILWVRSELYDSYKNTWRDFCGTAAEKPLMIQFETGFELDQLPLWLFLFSILKLSVTLKK